MVERASTNVRSPRSATYLGLGIVTLATLMYEIGLTRIFSVTMWYHFAFVSISLALFGMTVGALLVFLRPRSFPDESVKERLWLFSLLFAVSVPLSIILQLRLPFEPEWTWSGMGSVLLTCLIIAVPFVFGGVVVCLALTRFPARVNRLYAADLVGAAIGCIGFVVLLRWFDGPSAVLAVGALGALGAFAFATDASSRKGLVACGVAVVVIGGFALTNAALQRRGDGIVEVVYAKGDKDPEHRTEKWNNFSRITVDGDPDEEAIPAGWGMSTELPEDIRVNQLIMTIDSAAATPLTRYDGDPDTTDFLRYDITNLAHNLRQDADVLVVGVGGGRDILSALEYDQSSVTGVEINGDILETTNDTYGDFTGHLDRNPKVEMVTDEARSYLSRTDEKYDIIQISLIDTWAATAAGAFALSENSLYTTDAFEVFFDSLKPNGILSISRWYQVGDLPPRETYRTEALAARALKDEGVANPRDHMLIYHAPPSGFLTSAATLLISPEPFSEADVRAADDEVARLDFTPVLTPDTALNDKFEGLASPNGPDEVVETFDVDISPPTDGKPFFFQMANLDTFLEGGFRDDLVTRPVLVLSVLGLAVITLALALIMFPLLATYFAGIGLAFLLVEISQLQRLSIFLGHPTYALTVVLFSILISSGIGSMVVGRFIDRGWLFAPRVGLLGVLLVFAMVEPGVIRSFDSATTPVRILVAILLLVPIGLLMGMPFSIGMRTAVAARPDAPTAFLWGINGAMSVVASVLGMVLAIFFGIAVTFWIGFLAYGVACGALWLALRRRGSGAAPPGEPAVPLTEPAVGAGVPGA
jgi:SAM-dependent methyltransferase